MTTNTPTTVPRRFTAAWLAYHTDFQTSPNAKLNMYALGSASLLASASVNTLYQPTHGMAWEIQRLKDNRWVTKACKVVEAAMEKRQALEFAYRFVERLAQKEEDTARHTRRQTYVEVGNTKPQLQPQPQPQDKRRDQIKRDTVAFGFVNGKHLPLK